jgi:hypothetical protein
MNPTPKNEKAPNLRIASIGMKDAANTTRNYEADGGELASECLDSILNGPDQAHACRSLLGLLNNLSGCGEAEKGARRGAAVVLVNVIERGLEAIRKDGGR